MENAAGDAVEVDFPDIDFDFDLLDGLDLDFDLAEFCVGNDDDDDGDSFLAAAGIGKKGEVVPAGLELDLGSPGDGGGREGSPDSVVTDDGPLASGDDDGSMSAYVSKLERFLMEEDDDGGRTMGELAADEEYFFGVLLADDNGVAAADRAAAAEESLAAHEDEATSRKRARQRRCTASMPSEEPLVTRRHAWHLDRTRVPAPWLPARALRCT